MLLGKRGLLIGLLVLAAIGCRLSNPDSGTAEPLDSSPEGFTAVAATAVSVDLAWGAVPGAAGYEIEARYGSGEFFRAAERTARETSYTHLVVPGSTQLTYRLNAFVDGERREVATASVSMPELVPDPVVVTSVVPFAPIVGENPLGFPQLPTIDPLNPDPGVMATLSAFAAGIDPNNPEASLPEPTPVSVTQDIGPEGGAVTLTDPNGVVYSLAVPSGLLEEVTSFTLDPIEEIAGLPFSRLLGAVDIFPPIPFRTPLTLTVTLPEGQASDTDTIVAFIVSSLNHELSMIPFSRDASSFAVSVYWGDTVGLALASPGEVSAQAAKVPSDTAEQISQQIAAMLALRGDSGQEAVTTIFLEILEGLIQQTSVAALPAGRAGRLAAPFIQSRAGIDLWNEIVRYSRLSSDAEAVQRPQDANLATQLRNPAGRGQILASLVAKIKQFLDTHTGCRTRDEFYAEAILDLLESPEPGFQQELSGLFVSQYGRPEALRLCTYLLDIPHSEIALKVNASGGGATETTTVIVDTMRLYVSGRGRDIHLYSASPGRITYVNFTFLVHDCPPAIRPKAPPNATFYIKELTPQFDGDMRVTGFKLTGVEANLAFGGANLGSVRTETQAGVCKVVGYSTASATPNKWGIAMAILHSSSGGGDHWVISGEDSYTATNTISGYSQGGLTENTTMILTVRKEGETR